jgi:hypothetical protein
VEGGGKKKTQQARKKDLALATQLQATQGECEMKPDKSAHHQKQFLDIFLYSRHDRNVCLYLGRS